jgi:hypothetical protein
MVMMVMIMLKLKRKLRINKMQRMINTMTIQ